MTHLKRSKMSNLRFPQSRRKWSQTASTNMSAASHTHSVSTYPSI